ncbi:MAG: hypothetical protein A2283_23070 [Lentisphaerae bacterium RIFOXYA12_FULL_48_11]|nr:MAG: hypothetical protein A2283_23070 [Lentisphaerae bacterium RIFOXYA12_FULL_48_11]
MRDYRKIQAWVLGDDRAVKIYKAVRSFPPEDLYGLSRQMSRAAYSVPSNIAEGSARSSDRDYLNFLQIARGSLSELQFIL